MISSFFRRKCKRENYGSDEVYGGRVRGAVRALIVQFRECIVCFVGGGGGQGLERYAVPRRYNSCSRLVIALDIRFGTGRCRHGHVRLLLEKLRPGLLTWLFQLSSFATGPDIDAVTT